MSSRSPVRGGPTDPVTQPIDPLFQDSGFWITFVTNLVAIIAAVAATLGWGNLPTNAVAGIDTAVAAMVPVLIGIFVHGRNQLKRVALASRLAAHYGLAGPVGLGDPNQVPPRV